ncbi:hypothetical protein Nigel_46 [Mycobacterium phage Nigel]|uniref:Helix-turn-helix DNA binding domain protein n=1 Tax=Mycobacterium phage Nigel TaxID=543152 RepID=B3VLX5_9CAUD|nr:gp46 [Mycobacterium phage Nigel]ACF05049.1 hypothetical protein Nigel_46 [Mycobacterium phage Nigel]
MSSTYWDTITATSEPRKDDPPTQWITVTPELAKYMLDNHNHGNRNIAHNHVDELAHEMAEGSWLQAANPIRFDRDGRMVDAQHTCHAIVQSGTTQRMLLVGDLDPEVQMVIDLQKRRSAANAIEFAFGDKARHTAAVAAVAKLDMILTEYVGRTGERPTVRMSLTNAIITPHMVAEWVADNTDVMGEIATYGQRIASRKGGNELAITPRAAVWLTMKFARAGGMEKAQQFFDAIATVDGLASTSEGDARRAFRAAANRMTAAERSSLMPLVFGVKAWNTWRDGKELRLLRAFPNGQPAELEDVR